MVSSDIFVTSLAPSPKTVPPLGMKPPANITGSYAGMDAVTLKVQRKEGGSRADFPTQVTVRAGTFAPTS